MTTPPGGQGQPPPQPPPQGQPPTPGDGKPSTDERLTSLESTQKEQGGKLDAILARLPGGGQPSQGAPAPQDTGGSVGEQVRRGVAEIRAREQAEAQQQTAAQQAAQWRAGVDAHLAEHRPAQPKTGFRAAVERAVHGRPPGERRR